MIVPRDVIVLYEVVSLFMPCDLYIYTRLNNPILK